MIKRFLFFIFVFLNLYKSAIVYYDGVENDSSIETAWKNGGLLNQTLEALGPGDELVFANTTYYMVGGITADGLRDVVFRFEGTIVFSDNTDTWPKDGTGAVLECFQFYNFSNVTFTSSSTGLFNGQGEAWWGIIPYLEYKENRPRMFSLGQSNGILLENLEFVNSPYWTVWIYSVDTLEIRYSKISNRRDNYDGHNWYNLLAFNTDGFDVSGSNIYIHDVTVWNQDDCICVKDGSQNVLVERVNASGQGLSIGSIGGSDVRNVTFRDCYMHKTYKGIYLKFRGTGVISDVLYENIVLVEPDYPLWIGPQQPSHECDLFWPELPDTRCLMPTNASYIDITLRNITVIDPVERIGVIMGSESNPIVNITFDSVVVTNPPKDYLCYYVGSGSSVNSSPVPPCFNSPASSE